MRPYLKPARSLPAIFKPLLLGYRDGAVDITDGGIPLGQNGNNCDIHVESLACDLPHHILLQIGADLVVKWVVLQLVLLQILKAVLEGPPGQRVALDRLALLKDLQYFHASYTSCSWNYLIEHASKVRLTLKTITHHMLVQGQRSYQPGYGHAQIHGPVSARLSWRLPPYPQGSD